MFRNPPLLVSLTPLLLFLSAHFSFLKQCSKFMVGEDNFWLKVEQQQLLKSNLTRPMPRSRGSEGSQRQSPRVPLHLKTTACSESNGMIRRHSFDRSPKLDDHRRSPRSPLPEKKRGSKIAGLETKLTQTQEELKKLKEQLASTEAAKRNAELELEETKKHVPGATIPNVEEQQDHNALPPKEPATDVFEVVSSASVSTEPPLSEEREFVQKDAAEAKPTMIEELSNDNPEICELNAKMAEMEKVIETLAAESASLKKQVEEAKESVEVSKAKEEEIGAKLVKMEAEVRESRTEVQQLGEKLEVVEVEKVALEVEMKRLRVQTEQWRKAAEAAAAVLSTGEEGNGRRGPPERCGSMNKHLGGSGVGRFVGSPGIEMEGGGKRKSGMRMFWKKGQK